MKNFILTLVMLITGLTTNSLNAQGSWTLQTNPTSDDGESMQFVSATEGWIGLNSSQLLHTTNAGQTWNIITPTDDMVGGMDAPGSRISFIDATTGWIMKSSADDNENFLGTNLYKTTNGGSTWTRTILSTNAGDAGIQVQFVDANNGWVLIYNMDTSTPIFKRTTDGGATWTTTNGGGIFYYVNENVGYAFSAGPQMPPPYTIFKTTDGGTNWTPQYVDNTSGELNAIQFTDVNNGWIVGNNGKIFKTTDGGANWTPITNTGFNANYDYNPLSFINSTTGWIGARNNSNGSHFTLSTTDGGATWSTQTITICNDVFSMYFWDANHGWATSDSGTIAKYSISNGPYSNATLNGPWFLYSDVTPIDPYNDNLLYLVFDGNGNVTDNSGFAGPFTGNYIVSASGEIAVKITNGSECFLFGGQLTSTTEGTAIVVGQNWRLHKIANPGALTDKIVGTLSTPNCGSKNVTLNIDSNGLITSATGLAGPVIGRVYADLGVYIGHIHTGETPYWREIAIWGNYSNNNLIGRIGLDDGGDGYGFACGGDRTQLLSNLVRSDNTPVNSDWTLQTNPAEATADVGKIQFVTANEGWISISKGGLLHTTNGGATWTEVPLDLSEVTLSSMIDPAFNMCFINPLTGWVLKSFGTDPFDSNGAVVYKTTNGGLNWQKIILSQVPKDMGGQIQFIDENNGYASIVNTESGLGKYYKTTDGGTTWSLLPSDGTVGILYQVDVNNVWGILGTLSQTPPFKILHSNNGMVSFTEQSTDNSPGAFWAIQFTDLNHGWVVGQKGKILKTVDGEKWDPVTNTGITSDYTCKSVYFMNATTGWIGAQLDDTNNKTSATSNDTKVIHTTDGGANWTTQSTPTLNPYSIFFWDANNGWLTSDDNKIARFTGTLGVKENTVNKFITIYPNPNTGTFYFRLKEANTNVKAEIYTLSGQKVFEASNLEMQPQNEVNFAPQAKGIYFIKISDGVNNYSEKIMIK
jgi:photosystem II stability/assembly factor-like uncharacterized protein